MDADRLEQVLGFFRTLADANRLRIVGVLAVRARTVEELATVLALKPPTVSHHLAKLKDAGLVRRRAEGTSHVYALDTERLQSLSREVLQANKVPVLTDEAEGTSWERKVVRDFFEGDRLKSIPATAGKREVILRWFAAQFAPGICYSEREVNELVQRHYADSSTLRRLLVDAHLLQRTPDGREYRLVEEDTEGSETINPSRSPAER